MKSIVIGEEDIEKETKETEKIESKEVIKKNTSVSKKESSNNKMKKETNTKTAGKENNSNKTKKEIDVKTAKKGKDNNNVKKKITSNENVEEKNNKNDEKEKIKQSNIEQHNKNKFRVTKKISKILLIVVLLVMAWEIIKNFNFASQFEINYIKSGLAINKISLENDSININLKAPVIAKDRWCQVLKEGQNIDENSWTQVEQNNCILKVDEESKYIVIKDEKNESEKILITDYLNAIISLNTKKQRIILLEGETKQIETDIKYIGNPDKTLTFSTEEDIVKIEGTTITGIKLGTTKLNISDKYNHSVSTEVVVTDLVTTPQINSKKQFLTSAGIYTQEEAHILDEILEERVETAGLKTRAGVVAAARFITLEFKYKVPYFLENGRYQNTGFSEKIDGEGRYYHKGLYLSEDKYSEIKRSKTKPVMWGGTLKEYSTGKYLKNGLDCSGFVTWAMYNGGYDPGDIGAGPGEWYKTLPDLGKSEPITLSLLKSRKVKAGDLIGWNGHIGMIIGITDTHIYTADTIYYSKGLVATKYTLEAMAYNSYFTHIYDMSDYYEEDGNYSAMWE